jgi:hypothetical protein
VHHVGRRDRDADIDLAHGRTALRRRVADRDAGHGKSAEQRRCKRPDGANAIRHACFLPSIFFVTAFSPFD